MVGAQSVSSLVLSLFSRLGDAVDDEVADYVAAALSETDEGTDPAELCQVIAGFSTVFENLEEEMQLVEVLQLITAAREALLDAQRVSVGSEREGATTGSSSAELSAHSRTHVACGPTSQEDAGKDAGKADEQVSTLLGLCPEGVSRGYLHHVLWREFGGNIELTAQWVLETDVVAKSMAWEAKEREEAARREREQREMAREKKRIADRFQFQRAGGGGAVRMWEPAEPQQSRKGQVRYNNNEVVSRRGEKYVTQNLQEEWNGGSTGKVYTKGKRGKGFV